MQKSIAFLLWNYVSTPEVWCYSAHTHFIDIVVNDALTVVTECLLPTSTEYLSVLLGFQLAELRRQKARLSIGNCDCLDPDHILHGQLNKSQNVCKEKVKPIRPYVLAAQKLLNSLSEITSSRYRVDIHTTKHRVL